MIRVQGLETLIIGLAKEGTLANARCASIVKQTAKRVEAAARNLAPQGPTGDLKASITTRITGARAEIEPTVRYGAFVEFGTFKDRPQPFMGPAADSEGSDLSRRIEKVVGNL